MRRMLTLALSILLTALCLYALLDDLFHIECPICNQAGTLHYAGGRLICRCQWHGDVPLHD